MQYGNYRSKAILTLKTPRKNASENIVCLSRNLTILTSIRIEANSVDPYQTAPKRSLIWVHTVLSKMLLKRFSRRESRRLLL